MYNYYADLERMKHEARFVRIGMAYADMSFPERMQYWREKSLLIQTSRSVHFFNLITKQNWR